MPPNILSPTKRLFVHKVCVVGECKDSTIVALLEGEYNVEVVTSCDGKEYLDQLDEVVFLVESFTSPVFLTLFKVVGIRLMSPTYVRSRYRKHVELVAPRPNRPLYCELLKDCTLVMTSMQNKSDVANMAHFLGAGIRKDVIERATHVIGTSVNCKQYRAAFSMGLPILRPDFVMHIWEKRDELDYDITTTEMVYSYRLMAFEGIKVAFIAFTVEETIDMEKQVRKYRGEVVKDERLATHVVFNTKSADLPKVDLQQGQKHLTSEWLWQSVQMEGCASEENYMMRAAPAKKTSRGVFSPMTTAGQMNNKQTRSSSSVLDTSHSSVLSNEYSTDDLEQGGAAPSPKRTDKRHQVCVEMLETEQSYLHALELVMKFKDALENEVDKSSGEGIVSKDDIVIIFSRFNKIIQVHKVICEKLRKLVDEWRPENEVGKAWIEAESQLVAAYPPFINSFDTIKGTLDKLDMTNQRFHVFLKAQESSSEFRRNTMRDLIIRPVQRLPSVMLLLKEIEKRTDSKLADKESCKVAEQTITSVLEKANCRRAMNDEYSKLFQLCNKIVEVPPHLYKANRQFVLDLESESIGGSGQWKGHAKKILRLFLFNDTLEITKVRRISKDVTNGMGTISRLTRQLSVSNIRTAALGGEVRPYRHLKDVLLTSLRVIYYVNAGDEKWLVMVIRGEKEGDEDLVLAPPDGFESNSTRNFVQALSQEVYTQCGRDIGPEHLELAETSDAVKELARKMQAKRGLANTTLSGSMMLTSDLDDTMMPLHNTTNTTFSRGGGFRSTVRRLLTRTSSMLFRKPNGAGEGVFDAEDQRRWREAATGLAPSGRQMPLRMMSQSMMDFGRMRREEEWRDEEREDSIADDSSLFDTATYDVDTSSMKSGRRALSNASLTISKKLHISRTNLRSINEQGESSPFSPGFLPRSEASSAASSISPQENRRDGTTYTPTSRYGHRQNSLRSLFSFPSRSSIKRRESGKENGGLGGGGDAMPAHRLSTQSTQV